MANEVMLPDIQVTQADPRVAVVDPDTSTSKLIGAIGKLGGEVVQGIQGYRTGRAIQGTAQAYDAAGAMIQSGAVFDPETGELVGGNVDGNMLSVEEYQASLDEELAAQIANVEQMSGSEFRRIRAAMEQGRLQGGNAYAGGLGRANMEIENKIRQISAIAPGFEDVVRDQAKQILGFDPTGFGIRNILKVPEQVKSKDEEKNAVLKGLWDKADALVVSSSALGRPLSREEAFRVVAADWERQLQRENLDNQASIGTLTSGETISRALSTYSSPIESALGYIMTGLGTDEQGNVIDFFSLPTADRIAAIDASLTTAKSREMANLIQLAEKAAAANGGILSPEDHNRIRETVESRYKDVPDILKRFSRNEVGAEMLESYRQAAQFGAWENNYLFKRLEAGWSTEFATKMFDILVNTAQGGDRQLDLLLSQYPALREVWYGMSGESRGGKILDKMMADIIGGKEVVITGDPEIDKKVEGLFAGRIIADLANHPADRKKLMTIMSTNRPQLAYSMARVNPSLIADLPQEMMPPIREQFVGDVERLTNDWAERQDQVLQDMRLSISNTPDADPEVTAQEFIDKIGRAGFVMANGVPVLVEDVEATQKAMRYDGSLASILAKSHNNPKFSRILSNPEVLSKMTGGKITTLNQFNTVFRQVVTSKALETALEREQARTSDPTSWYWPKAFDKFLAPTFEGRQQGTIRALEGARDRIAESVEIMDEE